MSVETFFSLDIYYLFTSEFEVAENVHEIETFNKWRLSCDTVFFYFIFLIGMLFLFLTFLFICCKNNSDLFPLSLAFFSARLCLAFKTTVSITVELHMVLSQPGRWS